MSKDFVVALAGNPNCGKTSLFNELTGSKQHVGNWPGVTVEKKEGKLKFKGRDIKVVDLPGTYSLGAYSEDEVVARDYILKDKPDVVINVVDACNIERNLYLTMQILETGTKVVLALNMVDEAKNRDIEINVRKLAAALNIPVVATVAPKRLGIDELVDETIKLGDSKQIRDYKIDYGKEVTNEIQEIKKVREMQNIHFDYPDDWTAVKLIENDDYIRNNIMENSNSEKFLKQVDESIKGLTDSLGYDADAYIIDKRYEIIGSIVKESVKKEVVRKETASDKIDKVVTNKWLGIPIFAIVMFILYQVTIAIGNGVLTDLVGSLFDSLGDTVGSGLTSLGAPEIIKSFFVDGIIGGFGTVIGFIPMILLMYLLISILEDSGYMARAAYVMDRFMNALGLHGKTAVSLIISSGCNVAGIMSARTLESKKDRMIAILISPFISCTARLPIYALFVGAFFSKRRIGILNEGGIIIFLLYVLGIAVAVTFGKFLSSKVFKGETSYFVMELPPYRIPTFKSILIHMWEKSAGYVKKAGTIILGTVIVIWVLSNLPAGVEPGSKDSIIGIIGSIIAPIFAPAGFGTWQAGASLISGFAAKESVVGTLATIYGVEEGQKLTMAIQKTFTPLTAMSFMVMTLLYVPCVATIGAIKRETNSTKWALIAVGYTCAIAWLLAVIVYQVGSLLGF